MITHEQIAPFRKSSDDYEPTERLKARFAHLRQERQPFFLTGAEFDEILKWKLRGQYERQKQKRTVNTEEIVRAITSIALNITHDENNYELELRVNLPRVLRGVGIPVASAVLGLVYPEQYAVIDFRTWRQLFDERKNSFTISDYSTYLNRIREMAAELGWFPQEVDLAIWAYDRANEQRP